MASVRAIRIVGIVIVVIVVLIVIGIIVRRLRDQQRGASDSRRRDSRSSSDSSSSNSGRDSDRRHHAHAANRVSNYRVMNGKPVEPPMEEAPQAQQQQARVPVNAAFPRHVAKAGKPTGTQDLRQAVARASQEAQHKVHSNASSNGDNHSVQNGKVETIVVESMAELYSPKEDLEAELGVDAETLQKMVETYKKGKEYRERRVPVNKNFDLDKYNASKETLRASAANMGVTYGSKRGQITGAIYKKYGKNFTTQRSQPMGDVPSLISSPALHAEQMRLSQERRNQGHLEVRN